MPISHPKNVGDQRLPAISDLLQIEGQAFQHGRDRLKFGNVDAGDGPVKVLMVSAMLMDWTSLRV